MIKIQKYIEEKKKIYDFLLNFLEISDKNDFTFINLTKFMETNNYLANHNDLLHILRLITKIADNHHRNDLFFKKIEQIFDFLKENIKQTLSNTEIFDIIKNNKKILLYFLQNDILILNKEICDEIIIKYDNNGLQYSHFFIKEIKQKFSGFITKYDIEDIEEEFLRKYPDILDENFDSKILKGENDSYLCSLIRDDLIEDFITYVNRTNLPLSETFIKKSFFETNSFLLEKDSISLIEYSAFFGSIQIYRFLKMNKVELTPSLWLYSIHGGNADLIQDLEESKVKKPNSDFYIECFIESIKCHHNEFAAYFEDNFLSQEDMKNSDVVYSIFHYYNYSYFPSDFDIDNCDIFTNLCYHNYDDIVNSLLEKEGENIIKGLIINLFFL